MAITYTGQEGLAVRLGTVIREVNRVVSAYGSNLNTGVAAIASGFYTNDSIVCDTLYSTRDSYRGVHQTYLGALATVANNTAIEQSNRSSPLPSKTTLNALKAVIQDMKDNTQTFNRPTCSASVSAGSSNAGNAVVAVSLTNNYGDPLDLVHAETLKLTVTADSEAGATLHQETITVQGEPVKSVWDYQWPAGSGATGSFNITDAATTTVVTDGSFESWGGTGNNTPTHWTAVTGSYGTHILRSSSAVRGSYSIQLSSTGSTVTKVKQSITVEPLTVYGINMWAKVDATDGTGVFRVRLCDGSGTTISDEAGTTNLYTRNVNGQIGTSYTQVQTFFRTPRQLTDETFIEIGYSTAPGSTQLLNIDLLAMVKARQAYSSGPYLCAFSKDDSATRDDYWNVTVTNSLGTSSFVRSLDRLLGMKALNVYFPTSGSPSLADSLIN